MRGAADAGAASFASASLTAHLVRGIVGFGSLTASFALIPVAGVVALLLLPVGVVALRGCPACWAIGLLQTISRGRLQRSCSDGVCHLTVRPDTDSEFGTPARDSGATSRLGT